MKQIIFLLFIFLISGDLFAQSFYGKAGDIVKGKHVKYMVKFANAKDSTLMRIENVRNRDSINRKDYLRWLPDKMSKQVYEIVYNHLTSEELSRIIGDKISSLNIVCRINKNFNVYEVAFIIEGDDLFWMNFSPDRLHKIEKEVIRKVKIHCEDYEPVQMSWEECEYYCGYQVVRSFIGPAGSLKEFEHYCKIQHQVLKKMREQKQQDNEN